MSHNGGTLAARFPKLRQRSPGSNDIFFCLVYSEIVLRILATPLNKRNCERSKQNILRPGRIQK